MTEGFKNYCIFLAIVLSFPVESNKSEKNLTCSKSLL